MVHWTGLSHDLQTSPSCSDQRLSCLITETNSQSNPSQAMNKGRVWMTADGEPTTPDSIRSSRWTRSMVGLLKDQSEIYKSNKCLICVFCTAHEFSQASNWRCWDFVRSDNSMLFLKNWKTRAVLCSNDYNIKPKLRNSFRIKQSWKFFI